jgi:nitrate reductase assembly molybdenum cofactor insertion protein NarJ
MKTTEYQQLVQFLTSQFAGIDRRFDGLREELHIHFRETHGHFDEIYRRLERLEQEYQAIVQALRRIEALMTEEGGRRFSNADWKVSGNSLPPFS